MMESEQRRVVKDLALATVLVILIGSGYLAVTTVGSSRAEAKAHSMLQSYLRADDVQFGRFVDFKNGNACLEFTITQDGKATRSGAARFGPQKDGSSKGVIKQIIPTFEQCKIGAAG
jgi:hypothetical protein